MENESRIVELLSKMVYKFEVLTDHVDSGFNGIKHELIDVKHGVSFVNEGAGSQGVNMPLSNNGFPVNFL